MDKSNDFVVIVVFLLVVVVPIVSYINHWVWVVVTLSSDAGAGVGAAILMVLGFFLPPIAVLNGFVQFFI